MDNRKAIEIIKLAQAQIEWDYPMDYVVAFDMAISALQTQEVKQEVKKSGCTYKPDCPWYDGSKCNSPNDHGYHECDYDRGIFPESYEELSKNSPELDKENGDLQQTYNQLATDTISRQAAINAADRADYIGLTVEDVKKVTDEVVKELKKLPSAQPDLTAEEWNLVKQLRSYHNGSYAQVLDKLIAAAQQPEIIHCRDCKHYYYADNRIPQEQMCVCDLDGDRWSPDSFCSFAERREE